MAYLHLRLYQTLAEKNIRNNHKYSLLFIKMKE